MTSVTLGCRPTPKVGLLKMREVTLSELKLPTALEREPLLDAVFEVRFGGTPHIADILPGILFSQYSTKPQIQRLPSAEIPQPIRASDPNLMFAPTIRLEFSDFTISAGDNNIVIVCKLPYPKWPRFKNIILEITNGISKAGIQGPIIRYSTKYVNLIQAPTIQEQLQKINLSLRIGDFDATDNHISVQAHIREGDTLHIITIVTNAHAQLHNKKIVGIIVDVDSIRTVNFPDFLTFFETLEPALNSIRYENKAKFFGCLKAATIDELGPKYD